jgi:serine/threonine protein kinase/Tfp pilus assembly protein PilF
MSDSSAGLDPVEMLAEEFAARYRRGERPSLTEYTDKHPHLAKRIREIFPALAVIEEIGAVGDDMTLAANTGPKAPPVFHRLGDYRILREVGRGGMGVVYEAVQESLGRHVALKVFPAAWPLGSSHLERFRREARAVARLHHTNIVPVFGVGEDSGVHYYAMQFIDGQGLDEVLKQIRRQRRPSPRDREPLPAPVARNIPADEARASGESDTDLTNLPEASYFTRVAQIGLQVADALDYSHKQGILHRDVKPSNLLWDSHGVVWVTDFGLAKAEGSDGLTESGAIIGTLRYMAPERFQGRSDPRSDVYGIGATLYELLTLRPAFDDTDRLLLIERVTNTEPPRPRRLVPQIPRDLETIVVKALAKEPADRYPTAGDLADDLRRFLDDRPIKARRSSPLERGWRWCRRHPAVAGLAAALLLVLLGGLGLVTALWQRAERQGATAELARQETWKAFDDLTSQVALDWLATQQELLPEQKRFLESAVTYYRELAAEHADSEPARKRVARSHCQLGYLLQQLGLNADAEAAFRQAIDLLKPMARFPDQMPSQAQDLARCYHHLGLLLQDKGEHAEALTHYSDALTIKQALLEHFPDQPSYARDLARTHLMLGVLHAADGKPADAEDHYRQALKVHSDWTAKSPSGVKQRLELAMCHHNLSVLLKQQGRRAESESECRKALGVQQEMADQFPAVTDGRRELARSHGHLGALLAEQGKTAQADTEFRRALKLQQDLAAQFPAVPTFKKSLAMTHYNLGILLYGRQQSSAAEAEFRLALTLQQELVDQYPQLPAYRLELAKSYLNLGVVLMDLQKPADAEAAFHHALTLQQELLRQFPQAEAYRRGAALCYLNLGNIYLDNNQGEQAEGAFRHALKLHEELAAQFPNAADHRSNLADTLHSCAGLLFKRGDPDQALPLMRQAISHQQAALTSAPKHPRFRLKLKNHQAQLNEVLLAQGDHAAVAVVAKELALVRPDNAADAYDAAAFLARCIPLVEASASFTDEARVGQIQSYATQALEYLDRAAQRGFRDAEKLRADDAFRPIRHLPDFERLVNQLQKKDPGP